MNKYILSVIFTMFLATLSAKQFEDGIDTLININNIEIEGFKSGSNLKAEPISTSVYSQSLIEKHNIHSIKDIGLSTPNLYMPEYGSRTTSSIYIRGLGARIDQPVIGLNIDNTPILSKDNFDFEMVDIERIEVLRGPQSSMYGRNTMGGVINIYTLSPFEFQGVKFGVEYGSANSIRGKLSYYNLSDNNKFGYSLTGYYTQTDGLFTNEYNNELLDWERQAGARAKLIYKYNNLSIDNFLSISVLDQGGYPYKLITEDAANYNDISSFERINLSYGLNINRRYDNYTLSSVISYQYSDNVLDLDNDFTPHEYFTLQQAVNEHALTQDIVFKSSNSSDYQWLLGGFMFFKYSHMSAPVLFKEYGIDNLILKNANQYSGFIYEWLDDTLMLESDFNTPSLGDAIYHKSTYQINRWRFGAELRFDLESAWLNYTNYTNAQYSMTTADSDKEPSVKSFIIDNSDQLKSSFTELLPKLSASYSLNNRGTLFASISKGYKAGGFNNQMFSDVLQQQLMFKMGIGKRYDVEDIITYKPEYSWNYEVGGNLVWSEHGLSLGFSLFHIDCYDQQLTVFPEGTTTGRMMTNAGKTRSQGAELSVRANISKSINLYIDYGYTNAKFIDYNDGKEQYAGNYVPYAPQHTSSIKADYTIDLKNRANNTIRIGTSICGLGDIYWSENNDIKQPFYTLINGEISLIGRQYTIDLWAKNMANTTYNTFYFESIENQFVQQGRPMTIGLSLNFDIH